MDPPAEAVSQEEEEADSPEEEEADSPAEVEAVSQEEVQEDKFLNQEIRTQETD